MLVNPQPGSAEYQACWVAIGLFITVACLSLINLSGKISAFRLNRWSQIFTHFFTRIYAIVFPLTTIALAALRILHPMPGKADHSSDIARLIAVGAISVLPIAESFISWACLRGAKRRHPLQDLDAAMLKLLDVTSSVAQARVRGGWNSREARRSIRDLEAIAWAVEYYPPFSGRSPFGDARARVFVRQEGAKLAAVIRLHKNPLLVALTSSQFARVEESLCQAFSAWARGDWHALTENSPEISAPRRWFKIWQRMWPALTLAVFAIILPHIGQLGSGQVASSIRISLLVAAALSIVTGGAPVADRVQDTVNKSLAWKESKG
ncbi:hypothetical protein ABZ747_35315 [Kitasatospora cineracea]|uniref:hypothetical protein n=1 Tax=Kitasatospora cineracea TaxID=88074 RepID=UPI0033E5BE04